LLNAGMEKSKGNNKAKSKKAKTDWIRDAFRNWALAAEQNDCDPLQIKDAPEWVFNAYVECAKVVFPNGWPPVEKWNAEFLGEFLGRYSSLVRLFAGEVPLGPETQADMEKLKAMMAGRPAPKNFQAIVKDAETIFDATEKMIPAATAMAAASTYEDQLAFQRGLKRGLEIKPEEVATSRAFRRHTRTFWVAPTKVQGTPLHDLWRSGESMLLLNERGTISIFTPVGAAARPPDGGASGVGAELPAA
jgi:hypothetical protein